MTNEQYIEQLSKMEAGDLYISKGIRLQESILIEIMSVDISTFTISYRYKSGKEIDHISSTKPIWFNRWFKPFNAEDFALKVEKQRSKLSFEIGKINRLANRVDDALKQRSVQDNVDNKCEWDRPWQGRCNEPTVNGSKFCKDHDNILCSVCGEPAVRGCPTVLQLVCGGPLCSTCNHSHT